MSRSRFPRSRVLSTGVAIVAASAVLASCGGHDKKVSAPSPTPTPSATPSPIPPPISNASPLTGRPNGRGKPVFVVKLDNTGPAHPHVGLESADVVYIEQVEAGLTRLAAVFSSKIPSTVGPVRSARETDIELFAQYGPVAFAYSGAQAAVRRALGRANLYLASHGFGGGWFRGGGRHAPYNLFATPSKILNARPKAALVRDIGFRFGAALTGRPVAGAPAAPLMKPTRGFDAKFKMARVGWRWSASKRAFLWSMDGRAASSVGHGQITADNVIVQYVRVKASRLKDVNGNHSPYTYTVGKGKALFFRDGRYISGTWSRAKKTVGTTWMVGSRRYPMKPGRTWIILVSSPKRVSLA